MHPVGDTEPHKPRRPADITGSRISAGKYGATTGRSAMPVPPGKARIVACSRSASTAAAARASSPRPSCCRSPRSTRAATRRRSRASAPSAPARRSSRSAGSTTAPIRVREPVAEPDALIVQDPTLLHQVDVFGGLSRPDGYVLVNTSRTRRRARARRALRSGFAAGRIADRAGDRARARAPRPAAANAALLGGFAALTGVVSLGSRRRARSASGSRRRSPTATSRPPTAAHAFVAELDRSCQCVARSRARGRSPRPWRSAARR